MAVSIVALSITAYLSFTYADEILRERTGDQLISESTVRGNSILFIMGTRIRETQVLAADQIIRTIVEELNAANPSVKTSLIEEKKPEFLTQVKGFQNLVGFSIELEDVQILGKDGQVLFSLGRIESKNLSENELFQRGLTEAFVDFESSGNSKKMLVTTPIFAKNSVRGAESIGVLIAKMRTAAIDEIVLNRSGLGKTGEVYLVNDQRLMLSESRFIENAIFQQIVNTLPVNKCFDDGQTYAGIYPDYRDVSIYGSSFCAKDLGFVLLAEINEDESIQPILVLQDRIIQTGIASTLGTGAVAFILSKTLSTPLIQLRNASNEIAKGNFSVRTKIKTKDEIGDLSASFDIMAQKLQDSLIEIKEKESVIKQQEDILLQFSDYSENYCVCMVDIMNSTRITKNLSETETSNFYRIFLNSTALIVRNFGGIVVKNIGDALLFYFPNLDPQNDAVFRKTLDCCLQMAESRSEIKKKLEDENLPTFDYRISATYGPVRIARLSTSSVNDIFGSTVNRCAKINRFAPANGVIIGKEFYDNAKHFDEFSFKQITDNLQEDQGYTSYLVARKIKEN